MIEVTEWTEERWARGGVQIRMQLTMQSRDDVAAVRLFVECRRRAGEQLALPLVTKTACAFCATVHEGFDDLVQCTVCDALVCNGCSAPRDGFDLCGNCLEGKTAPLP